jgi:hypothetical protein
MGEEREPATALESGGLLILESCPDSAILFDRNWKLFYANPTFQR